MEHDAQTVSLNKILQFNMGPLVKNKYITYMDGRLAVVYM